VHTEKPTATEAVSANNDQTTQVIAALKNAGVDPKDIRTTNFSINPIHNTIRKAGKLRPQLMSWITPCT